MGPWSEVVLVCTCMSVHNGFTTEVYKFTYPPSHAHLGALELTI